MSALSRRKGAAYERELAKRWRDMALFVRAARGLVQSRSAREVPDVDGTPYWVEAKRRKVHNLRAAMQQAIAASDGRIPLVVARYDGDSADDALVVMRLADWERLESNANVLAKVPS